MTTIGNKIYLAGPVTGILNGNKQAFDAAHIAFEQRGFIVFGTHLLPKGLSEQFYMRTGFSMIEECEFIAVLNGWESSIGALTEVNYAMKLGLKIVDTDIIKNVYMSKQSQRKLGEGSPAVTPCNGGAIQEEQHRSLSFPVPTYSEQQVELLKYKTEELTFGTVDQAIEQKKDIDTAMKHLEDE